MADEEDQSVRKQVISLLKGRNAHIDLAGALKELPVEDRGRVPDKLPYSIWSLLKHIELAQWDIVDFSTNSQYKARNWPDDYWPDSPQPASAEEWDETLNKIEEDRQKMIGLIESGEDLHVPFAHGNGQNLLREAMLIADHNAYHVGQIVLVRRLLGNWE